MQRPPLPQWPQHINNLEPYDGHARYPPPSNQSPQSIYPQTANYPPPPGYPPPSNYPPTSSYHSSATTYRSELELPSSTVPHFTHVDKNTNQPHSLYAFQPTTPQNEFPSSNYQPPISPSNPWASGMNAADEPVNVLPIQSEPIARPTTDISPMENPPHYRRAYWVIIVSANVYLLVGSILLIRLFYGEVFEKGTLAKVLFIAITIFEVLPRLLILIQLRKIVEENISLLLGTGILFGKKEVYLLFGKTKLPQQEIDRLAVMSDLVCVLYIIWLGFAFLIDFGGIKSSHETDHRILILGISLAFSICILVARVVWECIKHCMKHPEHKHHVQNGFDGGVPDFAHHEPEKDKKKKKKEKKSKKKKKEKERDVVD